MKLVVLYGSETGTAQDVAEQIWRESKAYGFNGPVLAMDEYPMHNLLEDELAVFVVATTGNGDEPGNMKRSWRTLLRKNLPSTSLQRLQYACLGLGDSSYTKFNFVAKKLHKRLLQLSAHNIVPLGLCDDQHEHGISAVLLPWCQQLWIEIASHFPHMTKSPEITGATIFKWRVKIVDETFVMAATDHWEWPLIEKCERFILRENERTTALDHFQDVRLLKFETSDDVHWQPGDVIKVRPCNSDEQIAIFFDLIKEHALPFDENTVIHVDTIHEGMQLPLAYKRPVTLRLLAKYVWDFSFKPRQRTFELLALNCNDMLERERMLEFTTLDGLDDLIQYINRPRRTILEVLQDFRSATSKLQLHQLFELFPIIQTKSFSIASMPAEGSLNILVAVVKYKTKMSLPRLGLCSNWLKSLQPGCRILATIKSGTLALPQNAQTPLILIGPGTGIAPLRSIIQHKCEQQSVNQCIAEIVVFFGCRNRRKDFHFVDDFVRWQAMNVMRLFTAFSRDQDEKIYVQHLIRKNKTFLRTLITEREAHIFVSGSSKNMPKEVREALIYVLDDDEQYLEQLIKSRRYQEETWS